MPQHSQVPTQIYNRFLQCLLKEIFFLSLNISNQLGTQVSLRETKCTTNCLSQREKGKRGENHSYSKHLALAWVPPHSLAKILGTLLTDRCWASLPLLKGDIKEQEISNSKCNGVPYPTKLTTNTYQPFIHRGPRAQPNPWPPTQEVLLETKHEGASVNNQTAGSNGSTNTQREKD